MKIHEDTKQKLQSRCIFLLEFYKVLMGSLLILFVPQKCGDHICSFEDSVRREIPAVAINVISCIYMLYLYTIEIKRENWCIKYLDIDPNKANNNLDKEIEDYPVFKKQMFNINKKYKNNSIGCITLYSVNMSVSLVYIIKHWAGTIALAPLISYIILVVGKLYNTYFISSASITEERAYSSYLTISKTYNTIDSDFIDKNKV